MQEERDLPKIIGSGEKDARLATKVARMRVFSVQILLQRDHLNGSAPDVRKINEELDYFINFSRPLYLDTTEKKNADLIVDGPLSKQKIVEQILNAIAPFLKEKNR